MNRRSLLRAGVGVAGLGFAGCQELRGCTDEIACFAFEYHGMDDAPSGLEIEHTGGDQQLQADEVFVTSVIEDYETREMKTVAWAELEDDIGPSDTINGEAIEISFAWTEIVQILWRQGDDERVIEAWVYDDDVS